jgi:hypothetical protein
MSLEQPVLAYHDPQFLGSEEARPLRIIEPVPAARPRPVFAKSRRPNGDDGRQDEAN